MQSNVTFPSKRLMLSLFVCSVLPILLMGRSFLQGNNIFSSLASIGFGIFFTLLCFVPFYSIKHRTRLDFSAFAKNTSQTGFFFVSSYYCMYFTVITVSFLIRFCDMFVSGVNPNVDTKVIVFLILCICVYGASKGINPLSRVSIFVLARPAPSCATLRTGFSTGRMRRAVPPRSSHRRAPCRPSRPWHGSRDRDRPEA